MLAEISTACAKSPLTPVPSRSTLQGDFAHPTTLPGETKRRDSNPSKQDSSASSANAHGKSLLSDA
jgi:hypothetical protein